ncbi:AfsR/SARP family transcriptional regulator [Nocardiopsis sp. LOL_012]|uniref:AfsR/SARP family transcriptional regulator n=1 Tax=Nocardiopsis sp. LOL_012 TaxID=3345409 RepID=UPI003A85AA42
MSVGGPRQCCVLGALLVHFRREVTVDQLISYLWSDDPPRTARSVIQVQISHLRRAFPGHIRTTPGGYALDVDAEAVDLHRFRLLRDAASSAEPERAVELLEQALSCWRGVPFSGVGSDFLDQTVVVPLREEHSSAVISWASNALEMGRCADVVSRLTPLVSEDPFREKTHHLLITALWRDNERARALALYEEFRARLAEELGVDPGPDLVSLHARMLREDSAAETGPDQGDRYLVRSDLPRDLPDFTGRREALRRLHEISASGEDRAKVCVITGTGGEGKTTTAVRFGHECAPRYPDGQIFIDLYGYTANKEPLDPAAALGALLRAVGTAPESVPDSLDERSALWRTTLMGRRVLLVLDNAMGYAQVSPLLPSSPGSMALITTRNELSGLSGASFLSLGMFDEESSLELLGRVLGEERVREEPDQAREIIRICGGLPLALRVIAGRMLSRPQWSFAHVARRLGDQSRTFRELRVEGQSVETAIDLSFRSLNADQRRTFLLLGLMIGDTVDLGGAATLLGLSFDDADDALQELVGMCLLDEPQGDVYRLHDLVKEFALSRSGALEPGSGEEARKNLAAYYLSMAEHAAELMGSRFRDRETTHRTDLSGRADAEEWFSRHQENLADTIEYFASCDSGDHAWRMADSVWRFYALHGHMGLLISSQERALQASDDQGNLRGRAVTLIGLGIAHYISGRFDEALAFLTKARVLLESVGDRRGIIRALANLGMVHERIGRFGESLEAFQGVLDYAVEMGDTELEAHQWGNLAVLRQTLGQYREALHCAEQVIAKTVGQDQDEARAHAKRVMGEAGTGLGELADAFRHLEESLALSARLGFVGNRIYVHNSLGNAHRAAGSWAEAVDAHTAALELAEESGDRSGDAEILTDLGLTYAAAGRPGEATVVLERAHATAQERSERYAEARAALALGRIPAPAVPVDRARELLKAAERTFAELGLGEADQARAALLSLESVG